MKNLKDIIEEINKLDNDKINNNLDETGIYQQCKEEKFNGNHRVCSKEFWENHANTQKENAINFITEKYSNITKKINDKDSSVSEFDYEIAYYKTFQQFFKIVLDEEKIEEIDAYLENQTKEFFRRLNNTINEENLTEEEFNKYFNK